MRGGPAVRRLRRLVTAMVVVLAGLALGGCGSSPSQSPPELSARLTQMIDDSIAATGLDQLPRQPRRELQECTAPRKPGKSSDSYDLYFATVNRDEARNHLHALAEYWRAQGPKWSQTGFEVEDGGIDTNVSPTAYLHIDKFTISARYFEGASPTSFSVGGSGPCAAYAK